MLWYKRIRDLRIDNDLTKTELANKLDISERTLARYETGESEPTISVLIKCHISLMLVLIIFVVLKMKHLLQKLVLKKN